MSYTIISVLFLTNAFAKVDQEKKMESFIMVAFLQSFKGSLNNYISVL